MVFIAGNGDGTLAARKNESSRELSLQRSCMKPTSAGEKSWTTADKYKGFAQL